MKNTTRFHIKFKSSKEPIQVDHDEYEIPQQLFADSEFVTDGFLMTAADKDSGRVRFRPMSEIEYVDVETIELDEPIEPDPELAKLSPPSQQETRVE